MTLESISTQLKEIQADLTGVKQDLSGVKQDLSGVKQDLSGVKQDLSGVKQDLSGVKQELSGVKQELSGVKQELTRLDGKMTDGFKSVDVQLNNARIRDEEAHSLLKFSLEAREALRETMERRFDEVQKSQDQEVGLLKDVLRDVRATTKRP